MEYIISLTDEDLYLGKSDSDTSGYRISHAARAVVLDDVGKIALLKVGKHNYHKLPGGGIEANEDKLDALSRELTEEIGANGKIIGYLGDTIEHRAKLTLKQTSYCYLVQQHGDIVDPNFTDKELAEDCSVVWAKDINVAIRLLESDKPTNYQGKFIQQRDIAILKKAMAAIDTNLQNIGSDE